MFECTANYVKCYTPTLGSPSIIWPKVFINEKIGSGFTGKRLWVGSTTRRECGQSNSCPVHKGVQEALFKTILRESTGNCAEDVENILVPLVNTYP